MISGILPPARISSVIVTGLRVKVATTLPFLLISPLFVLISIISPSFNSLTSATIGSAPLSSQVLKKIGAITLPITIPPLFLLGINGISFPKCHIIELHADLRLLPVPTTSPTYATTALFSAAFFLADSMRDSKFSILLLSIALA